MSEEEQRNAEGERDGPAKAFARDEVEVGALYEAMHISMELSRQASVGVARTWLPYSASMLDVPSTASNFSGTQPPASTKPVVSLRGVRAAKSVWRDVTVENGAARTCAATGTRGAAPRGCSRTFAGRPLRETTGKQMPSDAVSRQRCSQAMIWL